MRRLNKNLAYLEKLVPYLKNPSEEDIHLEVIKLRRNMKQRDFKMKKLCSRTLKVLINKLNIKPLHK